MSVEEKAINILIVDDHPIFREGIKLLLRKRLNCNSLEELEGLGNLLETTSRLQPDLMLLDYQLPDGEPSSAIKAIKLRAPHCKIVLLSGLQSSAAFYQMRRCGADALATKDGDVQELIEIIRRCLKGEKNLATSAAQLLLGKTDALMSLTARENQVLYLTARGNSADKIATTLAISVKTVDKHRENLMRKLDAHNKADLVTLATQHGLLN